MKRLRISILPLRLAVARLSPDAPLPQWMRGTFTSITHTDAELSIVCDESAVPDDVQAERNWRVVRVEGPIPFEVTGVASALVAPLAEAGISVFLMATYDTDYLLLKDASFGRAIEVLRAAGHEVA